MEFEIPSWREIEQYLRDLAQSILEANCEVDAIVSIGRGGSCPSRLLSDYLSIPTIYYLSVIYYKNIEETGDAPQILQALPFSLEGLHILVCDDVSDTGNSLNAVLEYVKTLQCASIKTATVYIKPWTTFKPDFYVKETAAWLIFPWERVETLIKLTKKYLSQDKLEEVKQQLLAAGFERELLDFYLTGKQLD
jgi:hypoxanthine phosphoribosyltransferase